MKVEVDNLQRSYDKRQTHNPNTPDKLPTDHAGHLIANIFGGSPELDNLVSMDAFVNQSTYRKLENKWKAALENGENVRVYIDINYDNLMNPGRPDSFSILTIIGVS